MVSRLQEIYFVFFSFSLIEEKNWTRECNGVLKRKVKKGKEHDKENVNGNVVERRKEEGRKKEGRKGKKGRKKIKSFVQKEVCFSVLVHLIP